MTITWRSDGMEGLSGDTKPTTVPDGTIFFETDTSKRYIISGGVWAEMIKDNYSSIYSVLSEKGSIQKQRFVEWFDGKDISAIWNKRDIAGTGGIFTMVDSADEGYSVTPGTVNGGNNSEIDFNDIRHYNYNGCAMIVVCKAMRLDTFSFFVGFTNTGATGVFTPNSFATVNLNYGQVPTAKISMYTSNGSSTTSSSSSVNSDGNWHVYKLVLGSSNIKLYIDGVLSITQSTSRPAVALQPCFDAWSECRIRYMEVYNT